MKTFCAWLCLLTPCLAIEAGSADYSAWIYIQDDTNGAPETGVTSATSGIDLEYVRTGAAPVDLTESDLGTTSATHSDGGIIHVGGGYYRVDLPDAAIASGVPYVRVQGTITDMIVTGEVIELSPAVNVVAVNDSGPAATNLEESLNASGIYQVLYVDASAAGDADGRDKANAYTTINGALTALDSDIGGAIYVAAGTYAENVTVSKSNVTLIGVTGATVNAATGVSITVSADNVTLIGMEADATAGTDLTVGAVDGFRARGCTFANAISIGSALDTPDIQYCSVAGTYYPGYARATYAKLPSKSYLTGTANSDGDIEMDEATGDYQGTVAGVTGDVGGSVNSIATGGISAASIAANAIGSSEIADDAITAAKIASAAIGAEEIATDAIGAAEIATDAIGAAELAASAIGASEIATDAIGADEIAANAITSAELATNAITSDEIATTAAGEISDSVWTEILADHSGTSGSVAESLNAASSAGDPWTTALPGAYTSGQAGKILADVLADTGTDGVQIASGEIEASTFDQSAIDTIVDDMFDEALSGHSTAGTAGKAIADILDDTGTAGVALADGVITAAKIATDAIGSDELAATGTAEIADATLDEALSGHTTAGTLGLTLNYLTNTFESDGVFDSESLANAGGGSSDWTPDEKTVISAILGIPGSGTTPADPTTGILDTIRDDTESLQTSVANLTPGTVETRDLEPCDYTLNLKRAGSNTLETVDAAYLKPGDTDVRVEVLCSIPQVLPGGAVLAAMGTPTSENADFTLTKLGIDPDGAKFSVDAAADATAGTYWVKFTVTNNLGAGPKSVYAKVIVQSPPDAE